MMTRFAMGTMTLLLLGLALPAGDASAAEIKVLSTGNMANILADITAPFERATGHKLVIVTGSVTAIRDRVKSGEAADLTINERPELEELLKEGRLAPNSIVDIARSPFGVAVRAGAPKPDISTVDAFKRAFLTAESIAVPNPAGGAQDGVYFMALIERLGIADQLKSKIKLTQGGDNAAKAVATGEAQIGIAQRRNFFKLNTVQNLEPLPDIPGIKFLMAGGVATSAREPNAGRELARYLSSAANAPVIVANGMEPYAK
jgi:molybdate transport system substrate-binding protein